MSKMQFYFKYFVGTRKSDLLHVLKWQEWSTRQNGKSSSITEFYMFSLFSDFVVKKLDFVVILEALVLRKLISYSIMPSFISMLRWGEGGREGENQGDIYIASISWEIFVDCSFQKVKLPRTSTYATLNRCRSSTDFIPKMAELYYLSQKMWESIHSMNLVCSTVVMYFLLMYKYLHFTLTPYKCKWHKLWESRTPFLALILQSREWCLILMSHFFTFLFLFLVTTCGCLSSF